MKITIAVAVLAVVVGLTNIADAQMRPLQVDGRIDIIDRQPIERRVPRISGYFLDRDGDGYGDASSPWRITDGPAPAPMVRNSTDCDDGNRNMWKIMNGLFLDMDHDGLTTGEYSGVCTGATRTYNGRIYYYAPFHTICLNGPYMLTEKSNGQDTNDCVPGPVDR